MLKTYKQKWMLFKQTNIQMLEHLFTPYSTELYSNKVIISILYNVILMCRVYLSTVCRPTNVIINVHIIAYNYKMHCECLKKFSDLLIGCFFPGTFLGKPWFS